MDTYTVTGRNSLELAEMVNEYADAGRTVLVNGREAVRPTALGRPATAWQNGSVSVDVRPRSRGARVGTVWTKVGQQMTVTVL